MDFYTALAMLSALALTVLGKRYSGVQAVLVADSRRTGEYLRGLLTDTLTESGIDTGVLFDGVHARVSAHRSVLKLVQDAIAEGGADLDSLAESYGFSDPGPDAERDLANANDALYALGEALDTVRGYVPTLQALADPEWVAGRDAAMAALQDARTAYDTAMAPIDALSTAPDPTPEPVQLTLDLTPPVRTAPRPTTGTEQESCWYRD